MYCSHCKVTLVPGYHEGMRIDVCPNCLGRFLAHDAVERAVRDQRVPRPRFEQDEALAGATSRVDAALERSHVQRCPVCDAVMRRYVYAMSSGVVVDACPEHGLWLDEGELERIEAWSEATAHGSDFVHDAHAAATTEIDPNWVPKRPEDDPFQTARTLAVFGFEDAALSMGTMRTVERLQETREERRENASNLHVGAAVLQAQAEQDRAPTREQGGHAIAFAIDIAASTAAVWPYLMRIELYPTWLAHLDSAQLVSGSGSSRVQRLRFANAYDAEQRVTAVMPERGISWRDEHEWTDITLTPTDTGSRVAYCVTRRTPLPAELQRWIGTSLEQLAQAVIAP